MGFFSTLKKYLDKTITYVSNVVSSGVTVSNKAGKLSIRSKFNPSFAVNYDFKSNKAGLEAKVNNYSLKGAYNTSTGDVSGTIADSSDIYRIRYSKPNSTLGIDGLTSGYYFSNKYSLGGMTDTFKFRTPKGNALEATLGSFVPKPIAVPAASKIFAAVKANPLPKIIGELYAKTPLGRIDYNRGFGVFAYSY